MNPINLIENTARELPDGNYNLYRDGILRESGTALNGLRHGQCRVYTRDGRIKAEGRYNFGLAHGDWKMLVAGEYQTIHFVNGKRDGL